MSKKKRKNVPLPTSERKKKKSEGAVERRKRGLSPPLPRKGNA